MVSTAMARKSKARVKAKARDNDGLSNLGVKI